MSTSTTAKLQVEVEARTDAAVASFDRLQSSTKKSREEVEKVDKATSKAASSIKPFTEATTRQAAASTKASSAALAFSKAVETAKGGTFDIARASLAATAAFGPLGIAVGVAGSALLGYIQNQYDAAEATEAATKAAQKQARELQAQKDRERRAEQEEKYKRQQDKEYLSSRLALVEANREELEALEETFALHGRGSKMSALIAREAEIRADNARAMNDYAEATRIERDEELRLLGVLGERLTVEKKITAAKREREWDPDRRLKKQPGASTVSEDFAAIEFERERSLAATSRIASQVQRDTGDEMEKDAAYRENARQERFEREMQRIRDEQEAREEAAAAAMRSGEMIADSAAGIAQAYLTSGDLSAKGFRKAVGQFASAEAIRLTIVAIRETILGGVAASNPFTAALAAGHFAAAGQAAGGAATLGAMALALGAAGGGGGGKNVAGLSGSAFGASTVAANDRPSVSNSQRDTTPISQSEDQMRRGNSAATGGASGGGGQVIHIGSIQVLGAIDDTAARRIAQGIKSAHGRDGRLTG